MYQTILGIETSCDETAAAVLKKDGESITVLSSVIGSSAELQATFGGVIPEQAARKQLQSIVPVIHEALIKAFPDMDTNTIDINPPIDAIAVTYGPGLIGSLLVGVETAKTLAIAWSKPLLPINHLIGHYYANWISQSSAISHQLSAENSQDRFPANAGIHHHNPSFPLIGLLVSGGHTDLVLFKAHNNYKYLGGTRDDAAGECFDKSARLLGYNYPGGPKISEFAKNGDPKEYPLPIPMNTSDNYDFSFSGLKTAFYNLVRQEFDTTSMDPKNADSRWQRIITNNLQTEDQKIADMCASLESTIVKSLVKKTLRAAKEYQVSTIIIGGGVSANQTLREQLTLEAENLKLEAVIHFPDLKYCGDNAAMIAAAAFFANPIAAVVELQANPNLSL